MKKKTTLFERLKPEIKEALMNSKKSTEIIESTIKSLKDKEFFIDLTIGESIKLGECIGEEFIPSITDIIDCFISILDKSLIDVDYDGIPTNVTDEDAERHNHQAMIDQEWYETVG